MYTGELYTGEAGTPPIELVLLTGFLGTGKTTVLNTLLEDTDGHRTGVLMNEFGAASIDGALVRRPAVSEDDLTVYEVTDGSIFCTCRSASFVAGLRFFAHLPQVSRPQRLIVEASGMSDPAGLSSLLRDNRLAADYMITAVVCLVDAPQFLKLSHVLPAVLSQVRAADLVVLNKIDLAEESVLDTVTQIITGENGNATVVRTTFGEIPQDLLWGQRSEDRAGELVSCSTPETRPAALVLTGRTSCTPAQDAVDGFLHAILPISLRIKGWVKTDGGWRFVSDNSGRIEWDTYAPSVGLVSGDPPGLVVICPPEYSEEIVQRWRLLTE